MGYSLKKIKSKTIDFFNDKKISYTLEEDFVIRFKFSLSLVDAGIMIYPYLTINENEMIFINVNVCQKDKNDINWNLVDEFNRKSKFLKAYLSVDSILILQYGFIMNDSYQKMLELLLNDIFNQQNLIDLL